MGVREKVAMVRVLATILHLGALHGGNCLNAAVLTDHPVSSSVDGRSGWHFHCNLLMFRNDCAAVLLQDCCFKS